MSARRSLLVASVLVLVACEAPTPATDAGLPCDTAQACPTTGNECVQRTCSGGHCGTRAAPEGTAVLTQTLGDCKVNQCDGQGNLVTVPAADVPDDKNDCTLDACSNGVASHTQLDAGVHCGANGALVCDPTGACVGCSTPADCAGQDTACTWRTCVAGACSHAHADAGTALASQVTGDCKQLQCDGQGVVVTVALTSDVPVDGSECTDDVCTGVTPSNPPTSRGSVCGDAGVCEGSGACVACNLPTDCAGQDTFCTHRTCLNHACGVAYTAQGTALPLQTPADCHREVCDGQGASTLAIDDSDLPVDNNACTTDVCAQGTPSNPPLSAGASCGTGLLCDGTGHCVGCRTASDCPGSSTDCRGVTCTAGVCGLSFTDAGTPLGTQVPGNCQRAVCDGQGSAANVADPADLPVDGNDCTDDVCTVGAPSNPPRATGLSCAQDGGTRCNGAGACVECLAAAHCGAPSECQAFSCPAGRCLAVRPDAGTPLTAQTPGDCQQAVCDGLGAITTRALDSDLPVDNLDCTADVCTAGVPSHPALPVNAPCSMGGTRCDGAGVCVGCVVASDCGTATECHTFACTAGACVTTNTALGTPLLAQTAGDCHRATCDGLGGVTATIDDTDTPNDSSQCTQDLCAAGAPSNPPLAVNAPCNEHSGTRCNGAGACVQCVVAADCGANTACTTFTCTAGSCGTTFPAAGTTAGPQVSGDCHRGVCDGAGSLVSVLDATDVPVDNNDCTQDVCAAGLPSNPPQPSGFTCAQSTGTLCNGSGACVQCLAPSDCPGVTSECRASTCSSGVCGVNYASAGTLVAAQAVGDCKSAQCDGAGNQVNVANNADVPVDGNACTQDLCTAGSPSNPPAASGTPCATGKCDGASTCVACLTGADCVSGVCSVGHACQPPSCTDLVRNGNETDVDCGGGTCPGCGATKACVVGADCVSGTCTSLQCAGTTVVGTTPAEAATNVAASATVSVTFSAAMSPATLTVQSSAGACTGSLQVSGDGFVTCLPLTALTWSAGNTVVTVKPSPGLANASTYKVRVTSAALDALAAAVGAYTSPLGFATPGLGAPSCSAVVISQYFGAGGNVGAPVMNDYIELHNLGATTVSLAGWSVQYASAAGTTWSTTPLTGSIGPGAYYLVQEAGGANGVALPTADATGTISMSGTTGKVALVSSTTALTGACPTGGSLVDLVGFGGAGCFEGASVGPAPSTTLAIGRTGRGCVDTNSNSTDFTFLVPTPHNSGGGNTYACTTCGLQNETNTALEANYANLQHPPTLTVDAGVNVGQVFGQLYQLGLTEAAGAPPNVTAQLGFAPAGVDPLTQSGWQYVPASWNVQSSNNDEYVSTFTAPATPGTYWYTFRYSLDNGATWTWGDLNGAGSNPGLVFETAQLGVLTVP